MGSLLRSGRLEGRFLSALALLLGGVDVLTITSFARAEESPVPDLYSMKTPRSPAFVALGISPTEIQRPSTPAAFVTDVVTPFQSDGDSLSIPLGLAVEFSPYWMVPHYNLTLEDYANERSESVYRNLSISLATAPSDGDVAGTDLASGVRTTLFHPKLSKAQAQCATDISRLLSEEAQVDNRKAARWTLEVATESWQKKHPTTPVPQQPGSVPVPPVPSAPDKVEQPQAPLAPEPTEADFKLRYREYLAAYAEFRAALDQYTDYQRDFQKYENAKRALAAHQAAEQERGARYGEFMQMQLDARKGVDERIKEEFKRERATAALARMAPCVDRLQARANGVFVDVAGSLALRFAGSQFDDAEINRALGWGTLAFAQQNINLLGLVRYVGEQQEGEFESGVDFGGRLLIARERWGVSAEYVFRTIGEGQQTYSGMFEYRAFGHNWLSLTIGKDYGHGNSGEFKSIAGIQFNVGEKRFAENKELSE